jgi:hypothetical protein
LVASSGTERHADWLPMLMLQLEAGLCSGDNEISELIGTSFVENLLGEDQLIRSIIPFMGEMLRKEVKSICGI